MLKKYNQLTFRMQVRFRNKVEKFNEIFHQTCWSHYLVHQNPRDLSQFQDHVNWQRINHLKVDSYFYLSSIHSQLSKQRTGQYLYWVENKKDIQIRDQIRWTMEICFYEKVSLSPEFEHQENSVLILIVRLFKKMDKIFKFNKSIFMIQAFSRYWHFSSITLILKIKDESMHLIGQLFWFF